MTHCPRAAALVAWTINLAHSLGLTVVAEGVEDGPALEQLGGDRSRPGSGLSYPSPRAGG